ncbi:M61 family peptidase [Belliella sp. DSM 111904]|uniref:M61 family peptidase n=1 Tax=Belliella filtrata TaxID=2923435 RepID=A0ABS9UY74_9BACT|nr:M61 family peptidase [Belliella filtrata]MCH7409069.1 M61 family peptidase [Belliella filtrata]
MQYQFRRHAISSQFIDIKLLIHCKAKEIISLQLAAWRPGRYEIADFAAKIKNFEVTHQGDFVKSSKVNKSLWEFQAIEKGVYEISYKFFANQMDAGGSWSDDSQLYINFTNCVFDIKDRHNEPIEIIIELPSDYDIASSLKRIGKNSWEAKNYQEIIDSPLLGSSNLTHLEYSVAGTVFHVWLNGKIYFNQNELIKVFEAFTKRQIQDFGGFSAADYHFIIQLLPYKHYHGVEHRFSTVITIGPDKDLKEKKLFEDLIGVSSHELYHFWNVCRIRPIEMIPYDLSKEVYLDSGFVLEGITTYMGDLYLLKSKFFTLEEYFQEAISKRIQREFDQFGWKSQSIVDSSKDLWLDGYKAGIPDKKVNIYNRGSLIAFCLDILLIQNQSSLADVMSAMWEKHGAKNLGYSMIDFINTIASALNNHKLAETFFENYVYGKEDILPLIIESCNKLGIQLTKTYEPENFLLHDYGIRHVEGCVTQVHPDSAAYQSVMINDKIISKELSEGEITLEVDRYSRRLSLKLSQSNIKHFPTFQVTFKTRTSLLEKWIE